MEPNDQRGNESADHGLPRWARIAAIFVPLAIALVPLAIELVK
jgi:hypothetical protein